MTKRKQHSIDEISAKLSQASDLAAQGKLQSEIASTLGVSVMTLHRWRKARANSLPNNSVDDIVRFEKELGSSQKIADLQTENLRLRKLVTDLLLEKVKLEEASQGLKLPPAGVGREA